MRTSIRYPVLQYAVCATSQEGVPLNTSIAIILVPSQRIRCVVLSQEERWTFTSTRHKETRRECDKEAMPEVDKSGQAPLSNSLPHDALPSNSFGQTNSLPAPQSNTGSSVQAQSGAPGALPCCHFTGTFWWSNYVSIAL